MFVEILWPACATTERMNLRARQTVQIVELHRCQWCAELFQFAWRLVQFSTFIIGADDEYAHVVFPRCFDCRPVEVIHEIPVNIDVVESSTVHSFKNDVGRRVRGKSDKANAALFL